MNWLTRLRVAAGFTQAQAAEKIGVNQASVSYWETGKTKPRNLSLPKIAKAYGITLEEVIRARMADKPEEDAQHE